jgi:hypothetical protein
MYIAISFIPKYSQANVIEIRVTRQILFTTILGWRIEHTNLEEGILLKSRKGIDLGDLMRWKKT